MSEKKKQTKDKEPQYTSFAQEVWHTLSRVDVSDFLNTKGDKHKQTYISWAWAWNVLMEIYPESDYSRGEDEYFPDGSMSVSMIVNIRRGDDVLTREMYLQVLDYANRAIQQPNSHNINNSRMRCLTKALGTCGLGICLYVGHDLPVADELRVVAGVPRVPHDQQLELNLRAMDEAESLARLQTLARAATDYFEKWKQEDAVKSIREKYDSIAPTFEKGKKLDKQNEAA